MSEQKSFDHTQSLHRTNHDKIYIHLFIALACLNTIAILTVGFVLYTSKQMLIQKSILQDFTQENSELLKKESNYLIPLDYFLVNLAENNGLRQFKVQMEFKVNNAQVLEEINQRMPQIRDTNIILLSSHSYQQISTAQGKIRLKEKIRNTVNSYLTKGKISKVLFTNFIYN